MTTLLVTSLVAAFVTFSAAPASAAHPEDVNDVTDSSNFTVNFPSATDHYPGDQNTENGSIEYFVVGADAFAEMGAEDGLYFNWIIVHAEYEGIDWIDYSACSTDNTEAFGIDRGNNDSGTQYDVDLVARQKQVQFRDNGIVIEFLNWEDISNDPPYMAAEDAVVAAQGAGSSAGPCLTLTDEPGWYQITSFANGTVNDNARDEKPSESAKKVEFELSSNYLYVCECDNRQEAEEKLGPPPGSEETPTPSSGDDTPTPTQTEAPDDDTPTPTQTAVPDDDTPTPTQTEASNDDTPTATAQSQNTQTQGDGGGNNDGGGVTNKTPTPGDGPGFGAVAALAALLASGLLALRRR
jgi:PGF-CTERM protein